MATLIKGKTFRAQFIRAGVVRYDDEDILIREENLLGIARSFEGVPLIIGHNIVTDDNIDELKKGICGKSFDGFGGFKDIDIVIDNDEALQAINSGFTVSCSLKPTKTIGGGTYNNVPYDREVIEAQGLHMALVEEPRYEEATIFENSKSSKKEDKDNNIIKASMFKLNGLFNNSKQKKKMDLENTTILINGKAFKASELLENSKDGLVLKTELLNNEGDKDDKDKKDKENKHNQDDKAKGDESDKSAKGEESNKSDKSAKSKNNEKDEDDEDKPKDNTGDSEDKDKKKMFKINGTDRTMDEVLKLAAKADKKDNEKDEDKKEEKAKDNSKPITDALNAFMARGPQELSQKSSYVPMKEKQEIGKKLF